MIVAGRFQLSRRCDMTKYFLSVMAVALMAGGCQSNKPATASRPALRPSVVDISPTPPMLAAPVQPIQPIQPVQPVADPAPAAFNGAPANGGGGTYVVKKGDTLYRIAREKYGDGKQWQKIASANPGVTPSSLKVGQKLTVPN
jgi:5'-nucleotidase / UDP-sugar diphosphatase